MNNKGSVLSFLKNDKLLIIGIVNVFIILINSILSFYKIPEMNYRLLCYQVTGYFLILITTIIFVVLLFVRNKVINHKVLSYINKKITIIVSFALIVVSYLVTIISMINVAKNSESLPPLKYCGVGFYLYFLALIVSIVSFILFLKGKKVPVSETVVNNQYIINQSNINNIQ